MFFFLGSDLGNHRLLLVFNELLHLLDFLKMLLSLLSEVLPDHSHEELALPDAPPPPLNQKDVVEHKTAVPI